MDWKSKIKDIDVNNLAATFIAAFGSVSVSGAVQIAYCVLTFVSFYLTYKMTMNKNTERLREMKLNNKLLELDIKKKEAEILNNEKT